MNAKEYLLLQMDAIKMMIKNDTIDLRQAKDFLCAVANSAAYLQQNNIKIQVNYEQEKANGS